MAKDFYQVSLKAIICRPDGKVLGLNGKIGGAFEGYYDVPGGRIEEDEFTVPFRAILEREIKEETGGLEVELEDYPVALGRHRSKDGPRVLYVFFIAHLLSGAESLKISDEHEGYAWLDLTESNLKEFFVSGILDGMRGFLKRCPQAKS